MDLLKNIKKAIKKGLAQLRQDRRLTQGELAQVIGLSQQRYSEIERGKGSITAEQLIFLIQRFNLPLSYFTKVKQENIEEVKLQNALARLGAKHLFEAPNVLVPEKWNHPDQVIFDTLFQFREPRFISALAPVIVRNIDIINFEKIYIQLQELNRFRRLFWLIESTLSGISQRLDNFPTKAYRSSYRRALLQLVATDSLIKHRHGEIDYNREDFLDLNILSEKSVKIIEAERDDLAKKWNILTRITLQDFVNALKDSETNV